MYFVYNIQNVEVNKKIKFFENLSGGGYFFVGCAVFLPSLTVLKPIYDYFELRISLFWDTIHPLAV